LSRRISGKDMARVATKVLDTESEIHHLEMDNRNCAVDLNFAILMSWKAKTRDGLNIDILMQVLEEAESMCRVFDLEKVHFDFNHLN